MQLRVLTIKLPGHASCRRQFVSLLSHPASAASLAGADGAVVMDPNHSVQVSPDAGGSKGQLSVGSTYASISITGWNFSTSGAGGATGCLRSPGHLPDTAGQHPGHAGNHEIGQPTVSHRLRGGQLLD